LCKNWHMFQNWNLHQQFKFCPKCSHCVKFESKLKFKPKSNVIFYFLKCNYSTFKSLNTHLTFWFSSTWSKLAQSCPSNHLRTSMDWTSTHLSWPRLTTGLRLLFDNCSDLIARIWMGVTGPIFESAEYSLCLNAEIQNQ
jgi:hypothetical protein